MNKISKNDTLDLSSPTDLTCGCQNKTMYKVKVHWGIEENREFNYCKDCIKEDVQKGMLVELLHQKEFENGKPN